MPDATLQQAGFFEESQPVCVFNETRTHRFTLWRVWDSTLPYAMFIGLNPSTADETHDDPTVRRCIAFARAWGYGALVMTNLFGLRSTDPAGLLKVEDPIGPDNDAHLVRVAQQAGLVVCAWGNDGALHNRSTKVVALLAPHAALHCLKVNGSGEPAHPLYLRGDLKPFPLPGSTGFQKPA